MNSSWRNNNIIIIRKTTSSNFSWQSTYLTKLSRIKQFQRERDSGRLGSKPRPSSPLPTSSINQVSHTMQFNKERSDSRLEIQSSTPHSTSLLTAISQPKQYHVQAGNFGSLRKPGAAVSRSAGSLVSAPASLIARIVRAFYKTRPSTEKRLGRQVKKPETRFQDSKMTSVCTVRWQR